MNEEVTRIWLRLKLQAREQDIEGMLETVMQAQAIVRRSPHKFQREVVEVVFPEMTAQGLSAHMMGMLVGFAIDEESQRITDKICGAIGAAVPR